MELFKERLLLFLKSFIICVSLFIIAVSTQYWNIWVSVSIFMLAVVLGSYYLIKWLFVEPYKEHKKAKNEHSTKFKAR